MGLKDRFVTRYMRPKFFSCLVSYFAFIPGGNTNMNRGGFSWKRLIGISSAKSKISRSIGIPLTKSGRQRKIGKIVTGGGCLITICIGIITPIILIIIYRLVKQV